MTWASVIDRLLPFAMIRLPTTLPTLKMRYECTCNHPQKQRNARALSSFFAALRGFSDFLPFLWSKRRVYNLEMHSSDVKWRAVDFTPNSSPVEPPLIFFHKRPQSFAMPLFFYFSYGAHKEKKGGECPWEETWPEEATPRENVHGRCNTKAECCQPRELPDQNEKN